MTEERERRDGREFEPSRREFVKYSGVAAGGLALPGVGRDLGAAWGQPSTSPAVAAVDASGLFLALDDIEGEAVQPRYEGQVAIESWGWSGRAPVSADGTRRSTPTFDRMTVTKRTDASTPPLLERFASGRLVPSGTMTALAGGDGGRIPRLVVGMRDVAVTSFRTVAAVDGGALEEFQLAPGRVEYRYLSADGRTVTFEYDLRNGTTA